MYSAGHADIMKHKKDVGGESMLTLDMVREAQEALRGIARRTPLDRAPKFGENVYIKAENLQLTGAFKLRGAYNKIRSLTPEEAARGVTLLSRTPTGTPSLPEAADTPEAPAGEDAKADTGDGLKSGNDDGGAEPDKADATSAPDTSDKADDRA